MTLSVNIEKHPRINLKVRRTVEGNILIFDHEDIDIALMIEKKTCVTFPKDELTDKVYSAQDRMFRFLVGKGIIDYESIRSGNLFGALEAKILESKLPGVDSIQVMLHSINEYLTDERPYFAVNYTDFNMDRLDHLLRPDDENSTDLGDVPQTDKKGAHDNRIRPFGYAYNYSLLREEEDN